MGAWRMAMACLCLTSICIYLLYLSIIPISRIVLVTRILRWRGLVRFRKPQACRIRDVSKEHKNKVPWMRQSDRARLMPQTLKRVTGGCDGSVSCVIYPFKCSRSRLHYLNPWAWGMVAKWQITDPSVCNSNIAI
eukprot:scaffold41271_cov37-Tisochrysis_lutea.AAC.1